MDKYLQNNTILRILALVLACILWLNVNAPNGSGSTPVASGIAQKFPFPVHVQVSSDMVVSSVDSPTVLVNVKGTAFNITSLPAEMLNVQVIANARGLRAGKHVLPLAVLNMPSVSSTIEPATVTVTLAPRIVVNKPIKMSVQGQPATGYVAASPIVDLANVQISGAKADVAQVAYVVAAISVEGATNSITQMVTLTAVNDQQQPVAGVEVNPSTVDVTVPVQTSKLAATLVPQITGTPATGFAVAGVTLNPSAVIVYQAAKTSPPTSVNVPIDVSGFHSSQTVRIEIPLSGAMERIEPSTITATVDIEPSQTRTFTNAPITIQNAPTGTQVTLSGTTTVDLRVTGPASIVQSMSNNELKVYIDASQLKSGDTSAPLKVSLPDWVQVSQLSASAVPVQVQ